MAWVLAACGSQAAGPAPGPTDTPELRAEAGVEVADSQVSDAPAELSDLVVANDVAFAEVLLEATGEVPQPPEISSDDQLEEDSGTPFICPPDSVICGNESSLKVCAVDGMSFALVPCFEGFCEEGECFDWVCTPDEAHCVGSVATQCNPWGSGFLDGIDCETAGGCCNDGACQVSEEEVCDGLDNDCDGVVDNGVLSPCGDCNQACEVASAGPGGTPFSEAGWQDYDVETDENGYLVTAAGKEMPLDLWVSNSPVSTVSRIDTENCLETGRYNVCANPSRTAVDLQGNVYIGCRNDGGVAKITGDMKNCDKDGDGVINTAKDINGDGKVSGGEVLPKGEDECVEYITYPGGSCQRAVGVDSDNYPWVGEWSAKTLRRLHPQTGAVLQTINLPNNPYGLLVDMQGIIWISGRGGNKLLRVDPKAGTVKTMKPNMGCFEPYGIGIDVSRRIWLANCCCENVVYMYDPVTEAWSKIPTHSHPRGVAGLDDGRMVVGHDQSNDVAIIDGINLTVTDYIAVGPNRFPIGVAPDANQYVWAVNQNGNSAAKLDLSDNSIVCEVPVGFEPYTYSDMTGYLLHKFTAPFLNPFHVQTFNSSGEATWLFVKVTGTATSQCKGMDLFVRFSESDGWTQIAKQVPVGTGVHEVKGLTGASPTLQVKIVLPYQSNDCELAIEAIDAGYEL